MIIDFRCRPPTPPFQAVFKSKAFSRVMDRVGPLGYAPSFQQDSIDLFFKEMKESGVTTAVACGRNIPLGGIPAEHIAELVAKYPKELVGIAGIDPTNTIHQALPEMEKAVKKLGMKGICIEPGLCNPSMRVSDRRLYTIYAKCAELNVPILIVTGPFAGYDLMYTHPQDVEQVAGDFPRMNMILSHGCWPFVQETIGVACRRRNVFISPDLYLLLPGAMPYVEAANTFLKDQFLYASSYPLTPMVEYVAAFKKLPFKPEVMDKIMFQNAQKLLNIQ